MAEQEKKLSIELIEFQLDTLIEQMKELRSHIKNQDKTDSDEFRDIHDKIIVIQSDLTNVKDDIKDINVKIEQLAISNKQTNDTIIGAKGTWKGMLAVLSILGGLLTAILVKAINTSGIAKFFGFGGN